MLIGVLTAEVVLDEDFESGSIPGDWTQEYIDGTSPWIVSNGGYNGHPEEANSGFYNARFFVQDTDGSTTRLITPQFNLGINEVGTLTFYHAQQSWVGYQDELKVYYKNAPDGEWILLVSVTVDTPTWTLRQLTLPNPSTTYWLAFEGYAEYGYGVCIDDVHIDGEPMYNSDLQGIALTGPGNVTAGNSESFTITIFNAGIEPQSDYYLKLFKPGGIEIASQLVEDEIAAGSTENHFIVWNISDTEPEAYHDIYGSVELASDENIYNNETPPLTVHVSPPGTQYLIEEGFEGGEIPAGWTQEYLEGTHDWAVQTGGGSSNPPAAHTGTYNAAFTHTTSGTKTMLITPEINMGTANPGTLTFWHTQQVWASDQDELRIYYKNSQAGDWVLIEEYTENIESWTEETITLPNPSPNYQVAFEAEDQYGYGVCLDDIVIIGNPTVFDNDLAMIAIDGAEITNAGNSEMYEVQVKNVGDLPQSDYTVYLKKVGNNVVASQTITETLNPGEIAIHNLVWNIPANEPDGFTNIWAEVDLDGDENTGNNTSSQISVQIFPQGILEVIVGDGDETNVRVPICFEYLNSLTETIYFPNELNNLTGHINAITYYNSFSSNITNKPTKVWMGETSLTSLVDGWIPASQLTLVFDGIISYPSGDNPITINLDSQYYYSGQNLVVMVQRPMDTESYSSTDYFYVTTTNEIMDRTRYERDNTVILDPYEPNVDGYTFETFPNTKFTFYQGEMGDVQGYVRTDDGDPLQNAQIMILENEQIAYTDETGFFQIGNVLTGTYQFEASYYGYGSEIIIDEITYQDTLFLEFSLESLGVVNLTGTVYGSDDLEQGLANVDVVVSGFGDYNAITDANGFFSIPGVYVNQAYSVSFTHPDYADYDEDISVQSGDYDMGQIILNEFTTPPVNVNGVQNAEGTIVDVSWNSPGVGGSEFRYDDGDAVGLLGFTETYANAAFGVIFPNNALIEEVSWQLSDQYDSHPSVKIVILGLGAGLMPDGDDLLYLSGLIPNLDNQWNNYSLPEQIAAPNGFFVGVIAPNTYTGIALDDGVGEPWEYVAGRQVASTDWTSSTAGWSEIGDFGFPQNMLIRAFGFNYGATRSLESAGLSQEFSSSNRSLEHYRLYRFPDSFQSLPQYWTEVESTINDTTYSDISWSSLEPGYYQYAVTSVHTNDLESVPSFSNIIQKTTPAGSEDEEIPILVDALLGNIPNPFNPVTEISFSVAADNTPVLIEIFNAKGQKVNTLVDNNFSTGRYSTIWKGNDEIGSKVSSGVYFYKMSVAGNEIETRKMLLMK